jgi:ATP-dependent Clp protease ATP-binding subunit ClpA
VGTTSVAGVWPLIGRDEELRLINESLSVTGQSAGVAIIGRAGVGKSRLARDAAAAQSFRRVLAIRYDEYAAIRGLIVSAC